MGGDNRQAFTRYVIAKKIGFKIGNFQAKKNVQNHNRNKFFERLHIKIIRLIFRNYVKLYKPKLIFHTAAVPLAKIDNLNAAESKEGSVDTTTNILESIFIGQVFYYTICKQFVAIFIKM